MAETYTLEAQARTVTGKKVQGLRNQGLVPVVVYGGQREPMHLQIPYRQLQVALMKAGGTHLIDLMVDGSSVSVLAREVQRDVIRKDIIHVDFLAVDANKPITTVVRIHLTGESPAVDGRKGILLLNVNSVHVEALPADLIDQIEVDISPLANVGDAVHVRDLKISDKLRILDDEDEVIARITPLPTAVDEELLDAPTSAEPEVISKGKADEEEE